MLINSAVRYLLFIWLLILFQSVNAGRNLFRNSDAIQFPNESALPLIASSIASSTADHQQFYYDKPPQVLAYSIGIAPNLECRRGEWRDYNGVCRKRWGQKSIHTVIVNLNNLI